MWGHGTMRHGASSSRRQLALRVHQARAPSAPKGRGQTIGMTGISRPGGPPLSRRGGGRPCTTPSSAAGCAATADCRPGDQRTFSSPDTCSTGSPCGCPRPTHCRALWRGACSTSWGWARAPGCRHPAYYAAGRRPPFRFFSEGNDHLLRR